MTALQISLRAQWTLNERFGLREEQYCWLEKHLLEHIGEFALSQVKCRAWECNASQHHVQCVSHIGHTLGIPLQIITCIVPCEKHGGHCTTFVVVNNTDFMMARANPQHN